LTNKTTFDKIEIGGVESILYKLIKVCFAPPFYLSLICFYYILMRR